jgi:MFS family permease
VSHTRQDPGDRSTRLTLREIAAPVFLPAFLYEVGNGAIAPIVALTALDVGASVSTAGYMLALLALGQVVGDIPSSWMAGRFGDRRAMLIAAFVAAAAAGGCAFARSLAMLGLALAALGFCNATFYLARHSYLAEVVPADLRARAMSTLGGSHRLGLFVGPFVGAMAIALGGTRAAYFVAVAGALVTAFVLFVVPDVPQPERADPVTEPFVRSRDVLARNRRLFATLGMAIVAVGIVRAARQTVLPLWAAHIGLGPERTSLIFGIASILDVASFYPAGRIMDAFGRLAVALPSMVIVGATVMLLPLVGGSTSLTVLALVMSLGNGISSGIMMTLGADAAPAIGRIHFLSMWRTMSDTGNAAGPILVSIMAARWSLALGIVTVGGVGLLAVPALAVWAPRYSTHATRAMVRSRRSV